MIYISDHFGIFFALMTNFERKNIMNYITNITLSNDNFT